MLQKYGAMASNEMIVEVNIIVMHHPTAIEKKKKKTREEIDALLPAATVSIAVSVVSLGHEIPIKVQTQLFIQ